MFGERGVLLYLKVVPKRGPFGSDEVHVEVVDAAGVAEAGRAGSNRRGSGVAG